MITESVVVSGAKAGAITTLIALIGTDVNLVMAGTVGVLGGIGHVIKEFVLEDFKKTPILSFLNMLVSVMVSMSLVGLIFYLGIESFNIYVKDMGTYVWIFIAFLMGINQKRSLAFLIGVTNAAMEYMKGKMK